MTKTILIVSTYQNFDSLAHLPTGISGKGLYILSMDELGKLSILEKKTEECDKENIENIAYMIQIPNSNHLYMCTESILKDNTIAHYKYDDNLKLLDTHSVNGKSSCYLTVLNKNNIACVNYWTSDLQLVSLNENMSIKTTKLILRHHTSDYVYKYKPNRNDHWKFRQLWSHYHCIVLEPYLKEYLFLVDLGMDCINYFTKDLKYIGCLQLPKKSGPRYITFHPIKHIAFIVNELTSTITIVKVNLYNKNKKILSFIKNISSLPNDYNNKLVNRHCEWRANNHAANIQIHPNGKYLYVSNRGHDSIAIWNIDTINLNLYNYRFVFCQGKCPRHFIIINQFKDIYRLIVANQNSNNLCVFNLKENGDLTFNNKITINSPNFLLHYLN